MTTQQLRRWLREQLILAEPLDSPSEVQEPRTIAITATKKLGLLGCGSLDLHQAAQAVTTPEELAGVLIACLAALPGDQPADPNTLGVADVARMLSVSQETVLGWIHNRELKASNIAAGNRPRWIISRLELDRFLESRIPQPLPQRTQRVRPPEPGSVQFYGP